MYAPVRKCLTSASKAGNEALEMLVQNRNRCYGLILGTSELTEPIDDTLDEKYSNTI